MARCCCCCMESGLTSQAVNLYVFLTINMSECLFLDGMSMPCW